MRFTINFFANCFFFFFYTRTYVYIYIHQYYFIENSKRFFEFNNNFTANSLQNSITVFCKIKNLYSTSIFEDCEHRNIK